MPRHTRKVNENDNKQLPLSKAAAWHIQTMNAIATKAADAKERQDGMWRITAEKLIATAAINEPTAYTLDNSVSSYDTSKHIGSKAQQWKPVEAFFLQQ